jgi:ribonuclease BN (tRNA processing enzyme)
MERKIRRRLPALFVGVMATALAAAPAGAAPAEPHLSFTTLGTNSGPIPNPHRSEPANLVRYGDQAMLVDVGDGAVEQLARAGLGIGAVQTVFISHLHFDHTGGLFALLSLRYQAHVPGHLTIYGPPGTRRTVDGLLAAMQPGMEASGTIRGPITAGAGDDLSVVELGEGSKVAVGKVTVTATVNTHYANFRAGSPEAAHNLSFSYRFEAPGRSILYTGDTGPSPNVERLCHGADLLVSEILDPVAALDNLRKTRPDVPEIGLMIVGAHFRKEHLSPEQVGLLAAGCGAKALVLTHDAVPPSGVAAAQAAIAAHYPGPTTFAEDLQTF